MEVRYNAPLHNGNQYKHYIIIMWTLLRKLHYNIMECKLYCIVAQCNVNCMEMM